MDKSQVIQDAASRRALTMNRNDALDELDAHLVKQARLYADIIAAQHGQHHEGDEYRFNRWLEALRELRAEASDVSVEVVGTVDEVVRRVQGGHC